MPVCSGIIACLSLPYDQDDTEVCPTTYFIINTVFVSDWCGVQVTTDTQGVTNY